MNFKKDILLIDTELTGLNADRHEIVQLAAVLLDRKNLKEKDYFNSYVRPKRWRVRDPEAMKVNGLKLETLQNAPSLIEVIRAFSKRFDGRKVLLAAYVGWIDKRFLLKAFESSGVKWPFDYHYLDVWSLAYGVWGSQGKLNNRREFAGFNLEDLLKKYQIHLPGNHHDTLFDCRAEAEIFRRLIKSIRV